MKCGPNVAYLFIVIMWRCIKNHKWYTICTIFVTFKLKSVTIEVRCCL